MHLFVVKASSDTELTVRDDRAKGLGAVLIGTDPFFLMQHDRLVALAEQNRLPAMYFFREFVKAGGLISYGTRLGDVYRQVGVYAGKILKGAKPADLPIEQPTKLNLWSISRPPRRSG